MFRYTEGAYSFAVGGVHWLNSALVIEYSHVSLCMFPGQCNSNMNALFQTCNHWLSLLCSAHVILVTAQPVDLHGPNLHANLYTHLWLYANCWLVIDAFMFSTIAPITRFGSTLFILRESNCYSSSPAYIVHIILSMSTEVQTAPYTLRVHVTFASSIQKHIYLYKELSAASVCLTTLFTTRVYTLEMHMVYAYALVPGVCQSNTGSNLNYNITYCHL